MSSTVRYPDQRSYQYQEKMLETPKIDYIVLLAAPDASDKLCTSAVALMYDSHSASHGSSRDSCLDSERPIGSL